jgi:ubiquinol-cytochrome c reductase cytochrome c1 subunit
MARRSFFAAAAAVVFGCGLLAAHAHAEVKLLDDDYKVAEETKLLSTDYPFFGVFGTYDNATLQRGYQIYREICSNCHGLYQLSYRDLEQIGYTPDQVKALASQYQVTDGPNDNGDMFQRPAKPSDPFVRPFANEKAARAANNGAYPPDLSMIVNARKGGPYYVYSIMQGFKDPPPGVTVPDGLYYNQFFPGTFIAMPPPLQDASVTFADGAPNDLRDEAYDVSSFLQWASDPTLNERHRMGMKVMLFLFVTTLVLYATKRKIWKGIH